jgi:HSP20 family protein
MTLSGFYDPPVSDQASAPPNPQRANRRTGEQIFIVPGGAAMTIVRRPSPFGELVSLRNAMDRLFDDSFVRPTRWMTLAGGDGAPVPLDVEMSGDALVVQAQLPGIKPEDLSVTVENGTLTITGETRSDETTDEKSVLVREIRRGTASRTISLPEGLEPDKAEATFEHGLLTLRIPRAEQVKPRTIRITPTSDGQAAIADSAPSDSTGA